MRSLAVGALATLVILLSCPILAVADAQPTVMGTGATSPPSTATVGHAYSVNIRDYQDHTSDDLTNWFQGKSGHIIRYLSGWVPDWLTVSVPNGRTIQDGNLIVSGTPTEAGEYTVHLEFVVSDLELLYQWTITVSPGLYTVTFDSMGGSAVSPKQVAVGDPYGTLPTPTKAGYTFAGWYDGSTRVTASTVPTRDVTLKAQWSANNIQYTAPSAGNLAAGVLWSHQLSTTPGVSITVSGAGTSWIQVNGGTASGVPPSAGVYEVTVTLTAPNCISQTQTFSLNVVPKLEVTNSPAAGAIAYVVQ